jgi:hypothetical protein
MSFYLILFDQFFAEPCDKIMNDADENVFLDPPNDFLFFPVFAAGGLPRPQV